MFSSSSLCNEKDVMLRWISEDAFKFFFMQWQGCNIKMNKCRMFPSSSLFNDRDAMLRWISEECFQVLLYAMRRMQC